MWFRAIALVLCAIAGPSWADTPVATPPAPAAQAPAAQPPAAQAPAKPKAGKKKQPPAPKPAPAPPAAAASGMPDREQQFIAMLNDAVSHYVAARTITLRSDVRQNLEVRVAKFMEDSQEAVNWTGVLRATHLTEQGDLAVRVEIAPDIKITTWNSNPFDRVDLTLVRQGTPLFAKINGMIVGTPVIFSATMLVYDVSTDDNAVERPTVIARFRDMNPVP